VPNQVTVFLLALAVFLVQGGFHFYTATLPLALNQGGVADAAIGLIVGVSAIVQIPAAIVGGRLVDRFGGVRLLLIGGVAYLAGSLILVLPLADPAGSPLPFVAARLFQGAGIAVVLPSALSLVPALMSAAARPRGLSIVGAAQNLTLTVIPPLSLFLFNNSDIHGVAIGAIVAVAVGLGLFRAIGIRPAPVVQPTAEAAAARRYGITFRRSWAMPLLITITYVAHWGAVTAYLPVQATKAGADVGLYFAADGIAIFLMRLPTAWLAERITSRTLMVVGAVATGVAIAMLLLPITTPLLIVSGLLGGAAGGLVLSPVLFELSSRATDADRGSAFALYSGALAGAISLGSIGGSPVVALFGLSAALAIGIALIAVATVLTLMDTSLRGLVTGDASGGSGAQTTPV
jgi:MFS family permease